MSVHIEVLFVMVSFACEYAVDCDLLSIGQ